MAHDEEFFEIFFRAGIQARSIEWDFQSCSKLRRDIHPHIIAIRTFFSFFWSEFESLDPCEKILHIIRSLDIGDFLDLTHFYERFIAFIVFFFRLNVWVIPEAYHLILISEMDDRHRDIRTTADMDEDFRFFGKFRTVETMFEDILGDFFRKSWDDKLGICRK